MGAITIPLEGQRYLGDNPQPVLVAKCRLSATAGDVLGIAQTCYNLFSLAAGVLVHDLLAYTSTAWTGSTTIIVGDDTDDDGFLKSATIAPTVQQTNGLVKRSSLATNSEAYAGGKRYDAADTIDAVIAGATPVVGITDFYLVYNQDETQL